jgi:putative endonuclease
MRDVLAMKKFKRKGSFFVYITQCKDKTYYTGYTPNLKRRIKLHNKGQGAKYTRDRRPVKLVWSKEYKYFKLAFLEEKRIKRLTRKQKEKLVHGRRRVKNKAQISRRRQVQNRLIKQPALRGGSY